MNTETKLNSDIEQRLSALWSEGRFDTFYSVASEGYCALNRLLEKCETAKDRELIEWALPAIKKDLADMDAFRAMRTATVH